MLQENFRCVWGRNQCKLLGRMTSTLEEHALHTQKTTSRRWKLHSRRTIGPLCNNFLRRLISPRQGRIKERPWPVKNHIKAGLQSSSLTNKNNSANTCVAKTLLFSLTTPTSCTVQTSDELWISVLKQASSVWIPKRTQAPCLTNTDRQRAEKKMILASFFNKRELFGRFLTLWCHSWCWSELRLAQGAEWERCLVGGQVRTGQWYPFLHRAANAIGFFGERKT